MPDSQEKGFRPDIVALMGDMAAQDYMIKAIGAWFDASGEPVTREAGRQALEQLWSATLNRAVPVSDRKPSERLGGPGGKTTAADPQTEQEAAND